MAMRWGLSSAIAAVFACLLSVGAMPASADTHTVAIVWNDAGGTVLSYRLRTMKWSQRGTRLELHGPCASACTLYLALPSKQLCITTGASFRFHGPYGSRGNGNAVTANYMMKWYPAWVRSWILENGGLSSQMRVMNYDYASQFLTTCD